MNRRMRSRRGLWVVTVVAVVWGSSVGGGAVAYAGGGRGAQHAPIQIDGNSGFQTCGCATGSGTPSDPYVIGPWTINNVNTTAVDIENTTAPFVLENLTIAGNASATDIGIHLVNVSSGTVGGAQTSIQKNDVGILVEHSTGVVLDGGGASSKGPGIGQQAGTINQNLGGAIDIESSDHVTVRGWQMSANGSDHLAPGLWVSLDPSVATWGVGGVRFFGVTDSTIDHNAANNDTDISYSLFDSSYDTITGNTADYPLTSNVMVSDGSSYDTISGNDFGTADFVGVLIADPLRGHEPAGYAGPSRYDTVTGNVDHTDGPTGQELKAGIAPAFDGGIVILNGASDNRVTNNQATGSASADLVWAQEVLNPSTPLGVDIAPTSPSDVCNVTEGIYGGSSWNGNLWRDNVVTTFDPCIPPQLPAP